MRALAAAATACVLVLAAPPARALPAGYIVDPTQVTAHPVARWDLLDGSHTASVRREYPDSTGGRLLSIAEATFPPRGLLLRTAAEQGWELGADASGGPLWWKKGLDENRVPYAVTAAAVEYYLALVDSHREREVRRTAAPALFGSGLVYRASIAARDSFVAADSTYRDVHVATLALTWTFDDGTFVPRVEADRTVVLTREGEILAVEGDGGARESAAFSTHRGIGRKEQILR
jgi:hypothetical protein